MATNACLDELRRRRRRPTPGLTDDLDDAEDGTRRNPSHATSAGIDALPDRLAIDAALGELSEEFRVAVVLRDLCDLDYAEIAEVLDIPPGTVRSRIARGRSQLARLLEVPRNQTDPPERPTQRTAPARPPTGSLP